MIRFVGITNKAQSKKDTNKRIKKISGLFTFCIFSFVFLYFLIDTTDIGIKKFEDPRAAVAKIMLEGGGYGTGFLISNEVLVTAKHCVVDENDQIEKNISVLFTNAGKQYEQDIKASVLWTPFDENDDFALLKLSSPVKNIKPLEINTKEPENPMNYSPECIVYGHQSVSKIDDKHDSDGNKKFALNVTSYMPKDTTLIELESGISQGTSGGPVIDKASGKVIGIVVKRSNVNHEIISYEAGFAEKAYQVFYHPEAVPLKLND